LVKHSTLKKTDPAGSGASADDPSQTDAALHAPPLPNPCAMAPTAPAPPDLAVRALRNRNARDGPNWARLS